MNWTCDSCGRSDVLKIRQGLDGPVIACPDHDEAERYITDEAVQALGGAVGISDMDEIDMDQTRDVLRAVLPGILAHYRADLLQDPDLTGAGYGALLDVGYSVGFREGREDAENDADMEKTDALAAIERVRALHAPFEGDFCHECSSHGPLDDHFVDWPCPTVRALADVVVTSD